MPAVQIEVKQHYDLKTELALMDAVHSALVETFKIPQYDRNIRLFVHEPHRFLCAKINHNQNFLLREIPIEN